MPKKLYHLGPLKGSTLKRLGEELRGVLARSQSRICMPKALKRMGDPDAKRNDQCQGPQSKLEGEKNGFLINHLELSFFMQRDSFSLIF